MRRVKDCARTVVALWKVTATQIEHNGHTCSGFELPHALRQDSYVSHVLCFPPEKILLTAHGGWLSLTVLKGTLAGGTVIIRAKGLMPSAMGLDSQAWSRCDLQLPQVWATERVARADEFLCRILPLATTHLLLSHVCSRLLIHLRAQAYPFLPVDPLSPRWGSPGDHPLPRVTLACQFLACHPCCLWFLSFHSDCPAQPQMDNRQ